MSNSISIVPTRKQAAALLGITERALADWVKEPWFPRAAVGQDGRGNNRNWDVAAIRRARDVAGRKGSDPQLEIATRRAKAMKAVEDAKKAQIENDLRRLKLNREQGELVPRQALELFSATVLTSLSDWCEQLPDIIAGELPQKHRKRIHGRLKEECDHRRRQMALDLEQHAREYDRQAGHTTKE